MPEEYRGRKEKSIFAISMKIGLISDTHGVWDKPFENFLGDCDVIWHAGDWGGGVDFTRRISDFKPVVGVYGNCDGQDIRAVYPSFQCFDCEGMSVLMTHIGGYPRHYDNRALSLIERYRPEIFVCGHSHILKIMYDEDYQMITLNPGACGVQGWQVLRTALRFKIENGNLSDMEIFKLPR